MTPVDTAGQLRRAGLPDHPRYETTLRIFLASPARAMTVEEAYAEVVKADARANFIGICRIVHRLNETGFLRKSMSPKRHGRPKHVFGLSTADAPHALADSRKTLVVEGAAVQAPPQVVRKKTFLKMAC